MLRFRFLGLKVTAVAASVLLCRHSIFWAGPMSMSLKDVGLFFSGSILCYNPKEKRKTGGHMGPPLRRTRGYGAGVGATRRVAPTTKNRCSMAVRGGFLKMDSRPRHAGMIPRGAGLTGSCANKFAPTWFSWRSCERERSKVQGLRSHARRGTTRSARIQHVQFRRRLNRELKELGTSRRAPTMEIGLVRSR
jgi:hypothetical protein